MDLKKWAPITAVIFDLDGVLVDSRQAHFECLNAALREVDPRYAIGVDEHHAKYDGRTTTEKLKMLTAEKGLPVALHQRVWERKQALTVDYIALTIQPNRAITDVLVALKAAGYRLFCCSNSIESTLAAILKAMGILGLFERTYANESAKGFTKPHPQIYLRCFVDACLVPQQALIVEDSPIGRVAAHLSGAHVCAVSGPEETTLPYIESSIQAATRLNQAARVDTRWKYRAQVVIPMAGDGRRFSIAGYNVPKPLIKINGKRMIEWVIENLNLACAVYIFVVRGSHLDNPEWCLEQTLRECVPGCIIVRTETLTQGPADSVLLAEPHLDGDVPLIVANSDQFLEWDPNGFMYQSQNVDGCISVFHQHDPTDTKWSYARVDEVTGMVTETQEKNPISVYASTGIYYWAKAKDFVKYARQMMVRNVRVNGEFYVCPVYNEAIAAGLKIKVHQCSKMWGLGVPADLDRFIAQYLKIDNASM